MEQETTEHKTPTAEEMRALENLDAMLNKLDSEVKNKIINQGAADPEGFQDDARNTAKALAENRLYEYHEMMGSESWTAAQRQAHQRKHGADVTGTATLGFFSTLLGGSAALMIPDAQVEGIAVAVAGVAAGLLGDYFQWKKNNKTGGVKDFFKALVGK
jgi:hypothetical protein